MYEIDNNKIGNYLGSLIDAKFNSRREFSRKYLEIRGEKYPEDALQNMYNRICQILNGKKAIQTYDLLIFATLLDITCEQILTAGKYTVKKASRLTNYDIVFSDNIEEWESFVSKPQKLYLIPDEYGKNAIDYAVELDKYNFLKYLVSNVCVIDRLDYLYITISRAIKRNDLDMLLKLHAREKLLPEFSANLKKYTNDLEMEFSEEIIKQIASCENKNIIEYFTEEFEIVKEDGNRGVYIFYYLGQTIDLMLKNKNKYIDYVLTRAKCHNEGFIMVWKSRLKLSRKLCKNDKEELLSGAEKYEIEEDEIYSDPFLMDRTKESNRSFSTNLILISGRSDNERTQRLIDSINESNRIIMNCASNT